MVDKMILMFTVLAQQGNEMKTNIKVTGFDFTAQKIQSWCSQ